MFDGLIGAPASVAMALLCGLFGMLLGVLTWPLVAWLPARLQAEWRVAASQELGLPLAEAARPRPSWRRSPMPGGRLVHAGYCLLLGLGLGLLYWRLGWSEAWAWGGLFSLLLLLLAFIDAHTRLLPDVLTLSCLWLGLLAHVCSGDGAALQAGVIGASSGYMALWLVAWLFKRGTGQDGMGHGDFKLFAALGAWLGVLALPWVLFLAAGLGVSWACLRGRFKQPLPFGPFLALAGWLVWTWGHPLLYG